MKSGPPSHTRHRSHAYLRAFGYDHLDGREVLAVGAMLLDDGTQRVLEHLEEDMVLYDRVRFMSIVSERRKTVVSKGRKSYEMARHIHEIEILRTDQLNRRSLEKTVVFFADIGRVVNRFARNLVHVCPRADDADWIRNQVISRNRSNNEVQRSWRTVVLRKKKETRRVSRVQKGP